VSTPAASGGLDIGSPIKSGFTRHHGGPGAGGHGGTVWQIAFGMDLGAPAGTSLYAAFDGKITGWFMDRIDETGPPRYGAQVEVTSHDGRLAAFYTHFRALPAWMKLGATVDRGDYIGDVSPSTGPPHLHLALAENVRGTFTGLNLFDLFLTLMNTDSVASVTLFGDGRAPEVGPVRTPQKPKEFADEHYEQPRHLARMQATLLQRHIGNRALARAVRSPMLPEALRALESRPAAASSAASEAEVTATRASTRG
jgi:murein DD-endopeptidase MepM/ murein hydrolase activator NlpD